MKKLRICENHRSFKVIFLVMVRVILEPIFDSKTHNYFYIVDNSIEANI